MGEDYLDDPEFSLEQLKDFFENPVWVYYTATNKDRLEGIKETLLNIESTPNMEVIRELQGRASELSFAIDWEEINTQASIMLEELKREEEKKEGEEID